MTTETLLKIAGVILIFLSLIHIGFPRYFKWKEEYASLGTLSREMAHVHTFFIALTVFLNGLLCLCCNEDLVNTTLGQRICAGLSVFWGIRLFCQLFVYSATLWKGKRFETGIHILFVAIWIFLTIVFLLGALHR